MIIKKIIKLLKKKIKQKKYKIKLLILKQIKELMKLIKPIKTIKLILKQSLNQKTIIQAIHLHHLLLQYQLLLIVVLKDIL